MVPEKWRGALPITYHFGPGPAKVHLAVTSDWSLKPAYDVNPECDYIDPAGLPAGTTIYLQAWFKSGSGALSASDAWLIVSE